MAWRISLVVLGTVALLAHPVHAGIPVEQMVGANFLMAFEGRFLCSATLISAKYRLALTNNHCVEPAVRTIEREDRQDDGTVKTIKREMRQDMDLYQYAYGKQGVVGRIELSAVIVVRSEKFDLALVQIKAAQPALPYYAPIPPPDYELVVGQEVYVVGNPASLENTLTRGIVSHLWRTVQWEADRIAYYFQFDAAITGGSSGGAVYNAAGQLVGVPSAGYRGVALNFAIPVWRIKEFLREAGWTELWDPQAPSHEAWEQERRQKLERQKGAKGD